MPSMTVSSLPMAASRTYWLSDLLMPCFWQTSATSRHASAFKIPLRLEVRCILWSTFFEKSSTVSYFATFVRKSRIVCSVSSVCVLDMVRSNVAI